MQVDIVISLIKIAITEDIFFLFYWEFGYLQLHFWFGFVLNFFRCIWSPCSIDKLPSPPPPVSIHLMHICDR